MSAGSRRSPQIGHLSSTACLCCERRSAQRQPGHRQERKAHLRQYRGQRGAGSAQRPSDLLIRGYANGKDASIDVVITHPLAASNLIQAAEGASTRATDRAEQAKVRKYAALFANRPDVEFLPMAATVYGGWGPTAVKVIEHILAAEADALRVKAATLRWRFYAQVGALIARGNAKAILNRRPAHILQAIAAAD